MSEKTINQLSDLVIKTVGLVSFGANRERFFLLKSEEGNMPNTDEKDIGQNADVDTVEEKTNLKDEVHKVLIDIGILKSEDDVVETETEETDVEDVETEEEDLGEEQDTSPDDERIDELMKSNKALLERLEKAEKALQVEKDVREHQDFIEKARILKSVPVKTDELATKFQALYKADEKLGDYFFDLVKALDGQLSEAGIFSEMGTNTSDDDDMPDEKLSKKIAEGADIEELKKAYREMGEEYLDARRNAISSGRVRR